MANQNFFEKAVNKLNDLTTLRVSTYIGSVKTGTTISEADMESGQGQDTVLSNLEIVDTMMSKINLLEGNTTTAMTKKFEENSALREYHTLREQQAHEIVNRNLQILKSAGELILDFLDNDKTYKSKSS